MNTVLRNFIAGKVIGMQKTAIISPNPPYRPPNAVYSNEDKWKDLAQGKLRVPFFNSSMTIHMSPITYWQAMAQKFKTNKGILAQHEQLKKKPEQSASASSKAPEQPVSESSKEAMEKISLSPAFHGVRMFSPGRTSEFARRASKKGVAATSWSDLLSLARRGLKSVRGAKKPEKKAINVLTDAWKDRVQNQLRIAAKNMARQPIQKARGVVAPLGSGVARLSSKAPARESVYLASLLGSQEPLVGLAARTLPGPAGAYAGFLAHKGSLASKLKAAKKMMGMAPKIEAAITEGLPRSGQRRVLGIIERLAQGAMY